MKKFIKKVGELFYKTIPYILISIGFYHFILIGAYSLNGRFDEASTALVFAFLHFFLTAFVVVERQSREIIKIMREHIEFLTNFVVDVLDVATEYKTFEKKFERKLSDPDYKRVAWTRLWWGGCVSTIWLGLDHGFGNSKSMIFGSMLFGGEDNNSLQRYSTEHEALKGHKEMVKEYNGLRYGVSQVYYKIKQKLINLFKQES